MFSYFCFYTKINKSSFKKDIIINDPSIMGKTFTVKEIVTEKLQNSDKTSNVVSIIKATNVI